MDLKFTLIIATINRTQELFNFLNFLELQSYQYFSVTLIDQNIDDRLDEIVSYYSNKFPINQLRSERGASNARNIGIDYALNDIVAFPDDDCWYPQDLLEKINYKLSKYQDIHGLAGLVMDENGNHFSRYISDSGLIKKTNAFETTPLASIFLRKDVVKSVGYFDDTLGPGSKSIWQSGDDTDYILRAIEKGWNIFFDRNIVVYHPYKREKEPRRAYSYGAGFGRVLNKHSYPIWLVIYYLLRPLGGFILSILKFDKENSRYYWNNLRARLDGWTKS